MYCEKCGTMQNGGEKFCPKCGKPFPGGVNGNEVVTEEYVEEDTDSLNITTNIMIYSIVISIGIGLSNYFLFYQPLTKAIIAAVLGLVIAVIVSCIRVKRRWSVTREVVVTVIIYAILSFGIDQLFFSCPYTGNIKKDATIMVKQHVLEGKDIETISYDLMKYYLKKGYTGSEAMERVQETLSQMDYSEVEEEAKAKMRRELNW